MINIRSIGEPELTKRFGRRPRKAESLGGFRYGLSLCAGTARYRVAAD